MGHNAIRSDYGIFANDQFVTFTQDSSSGSDPTTFFDADGAFPRSAAARRRALWARKIAVIHHHDGWPEDDVSHDMNAVLRRNQASALDAAVFLYDQNWRIALRCTANLQPRSSCQRHILANANVARSRSRDLD